MHKAYLHQTSSELNALYDKCVLNPFLVNVPILYPLKTPENQRFSGERESLPVNIRVLKFTTSQLTFTCSKSTIATLKRVLNMFKVSNKNVNEPVLDFLLLTLNMFLTFF